MARRFIVNEEDITNIDLKNSIFEIKSKEVKHIQVLRHNVGDKIIINKYICEIIKMTKDSVVLKKIDIAPIKAIPNINLNMYIAILKSDKLDYVVQKAVELGAKNIIPFISNNVIVKLDEKSKIKRVDKLQKIADEACKQCGRTDSVSVQNIILLKDIIDRKEKNEILIFAYENEKAPLKEKMKKIKEEKCNNISIVIGPEGGFSNEEANKLTKCKNVFTVSLGSRILRAETAALNLISIVMYELD
ncbi:MAG: RsmE family RNA methyltransferase [Clostridia bacterium]